jgi:hypothetical protein
MKQSRRQFFKLTLGTLAVLCLHLTSARAASEPILLKPGDVEIGKNTQPLEVTVDLPPVPAGNQAILEFTAWYPAAKFTGFSSGMKIYWDGKELTEALNRPETFQIKDGREMFARGNSFWTVAMLDEPESVGWLADSPYFVPPEIIDLVRFRFAVPEASPGKHSLKIVNGKLQLDLDMILMVRNLQIVFSPQ